MFDDSMVTMAEISLRYIRVKVNSDRRACSKKKPKNGQRREYYWTLPSRL